MSPLLTQIAANEFFSFSKLTVEHSRMFLGEAGP
jgi:hypothetical protein